VEFDNRPLRRYMSKNVDKSECTINGEVKLVLKNVADTKTYITNLIKYIDDYFFTGKNPSGVNTELPHWISLAKNAFDFKAEIPMLKREESFAQLMTTMVQPFTDKECNVAEYQYKSFLKRIMIQHRA
jgi:hypothetical protein